MKNYLIYLEDKVVGFVQTPDHIVKPTSNILTFVETQKVYTQEDVKKYAFWAVQYSSKLKGIVHMSQIDEYLDTEF